MRLVSRVAALAVSLTLVLSGPALAATSTVDIKNFAFQPAAVTVRAGDTVLWVNLDNTVHRVHATGGQFDSGNLQQNMAFTFTFGTPGVYPYICSIHPSMQGSITVLPFATPSPTPVRTTAPPPPPTPTPAPSLSPTPSPTPSPTETPTPSPSASPSPTPSPKPSVTASPSPSVAASPLASPAVQTNTIVGVALIAVGIAILIGAFWWRFSRP